MMDVYEELRGYSVQPGRRQMRPHEDSSEKQRKQQQKHQEQGGPKKNMMHIQKTRKRWEESIYPLEK